MIKLRALLIFVFLSGGIVKARQATDSLRAFYIQEFPERFSVWPVLKQRQIVFTVRDTEDENHRIKFLPNNSFSTGIGAYLFETMLEITAAIPLKEKRREIYGETSVREIQANILAKKFTADVFYRKYSGFYINDKRQAIPSGMPLTQRQDVTTKNFGLGGSYVFNHRKFSLRSAFNYADRQVSSRGSFIAGGSFNTFKLQADSSLIKGSSMTGVGEGSDFQSLQIASLNAAVGYSYTFIRNNFFANGTAAFGPATHWISYVENETVRKENVVNVVGTWRLGVGYNSDRYFGGIGYVAQSRGISFGDIRFSTTSSSFRVVAGYRFREIGILKKRAADYMRVGL